MKKYKNTCAKAVSFLLTVTMASALLSVPDTVAAPYGNGVSGFAECHAVHDEICGYTEALEALDCSHLNEDGFYSCAPDEGEDKASSSDADEKYMCDHTDSCGYVEAVGGNPCNHSCEICRREDRDDITSEEDKNVDDKNLEVPESDQFPKSTCKNMEESSALLDKQLNLLKKQQVMIDESGEGVSDSDRFQLIEDEIKELYAHIDRCEVCTAQMEEGGSYYAKFYGTQTADNTTGEGFSYDIASKTLTISTNEGTASWDSSSSYLYQKRNEVQKVIILDGVAVIKLEAFRSCGSLESVTIPDSVTSIEKYAFKYCKSLASVTIPNGVLSIGTGAFEDCSSLTTVTIPDSVTFIEDRAFSGCSSMASLSISNRADSIGEYAFAYCQSLISVVIPDSVTSMGERAFTQCIKLTSIAIPDSVTYMGNYTLSGCTSLISVSISKNLTSIQEGTFEACNQLEALVIPKNVTFIGGMAFMDCRSLTSISIPDSVTSIGRNAFTDCTVLKSVIIPDRVTSIGESAFENCQSLKNVTIPSSVTSIGNRIFKDCGNLSTVVMDSMTPPQSGRSLFGSFAYNFKIMVPPGTGETYITNKDWSMYKDYILETPKIINFNNLTANGISGKENTNLLTLTFEKNVPGLSAEQISVTGATKNILSKGDGTGVYNLSISDITVGNEGNLILKISNDVFELTPDSRTVKVYKKNETSGGGSSSGGSSSSGGGGGRSSGGSGGPAGMLKPDTYPNARWEKQPDGQWKLIRPDGVEVTGWAYVSGYWYYMDLTTHLMKTGWFQDAAGNRYYLTVSGAMAMGWLQLDQIWYYLDQSGAMVTGWSGINGKWYYMDAAGKMLQNAKTPDGYQVGADGSWI